MADFSTPWASNGGQARAPTASEQQNGFPDGDADKLLFNWLHQAIQKEIGNVLTQAGISQSNADMTQLYQAIVAIIAAETGEGDPTSYLTLAAAKARLPIFPEFQTRDGKVNVSAPATGTIRVPSGVQFLHRGIDLITTTQTDFSTDANKTYHVRWSVSGGFVMEDLADTVDYNPDEKAETHSYFDSTFDDMLIARVVTNGSNIATITNLVNKTRLTAQGISGGAMTSNRYENSATLTTSVTLDWSRTPLIQTSIQDQNFTPYERAKHSPNRSYNLDRDMEINTTAQSRYGATWSVMNDMMQSTSINYMAVAV